MKSEDASPGLAQRDVGDGSVAAEDAESPPPAASVGGDAVDDVGGGCDLEHVGAEGVGAVTGDDNWRLGLVLGACRAAAGAAAGGGSCGLGGGLGLIIIIIVIFIFLFFKI